MAEVTPGRNPSAIMNHFNFEEKKIIDYFSNEQYVTNGGETIKLSTSSYRFFLFKPVDYFKNLFNLKLEIIVLFSDYENFEPRTLDAFSHIYKQYEDYRLEKICSVLISKDNQIQKKINDLISNDPESPNIIPFTYNDFTSSKDDPYFIRNRFRNYLYSRDLFDFSGPLKRELFFYGRSEIINDILNRHKSNENFGIFGLRRTGKTSIAYGVTRAVERIGSIAVMIDCQNTSFNQRHWNKALYYIINELVKQKELKVDIVAEEKYTNENAGIIFENEIKKISQKILNKRILIVFDEIERITFNLSSVEHWKSENDFIYFWQTLRSIYQKSGIFTFLISGTNPNCIENPIVFGVDNPIFNQITYTFVPGFEVSQTRDMVRKLGRIMGMKFQETIYAYLTEDYGGHPFLIRQFCSLINKENPTRPLDVDKRIYQKIKESFSEKIEYIEMIIVVLKEHYKDEYALLEYLARDDVDTFLEFASEVPEMVRHLIGYGIIEKVNDNYNFKIEEVKRYILKTEKYKRVVKDDNAKLQEISERRNILEKRLRKIVKNNLLITKGKKEANDIVLAVLTGKDKEKGKTLAYNELFNPTKNNIYFNNLIDIIKSEWGCFQNLFNKPKDEIIGFLVNINKYRIDAHASTITDTEFNFTRSCFEIIEIAIEEFE